MVNQQANEKLKKYIERIENLENQKRAIMDDIKDIYQEAKSEGFDLPAMKATVKIKMKGMETIEYEETRDVYLNSIGLLEKTSIAF